MQRPALSLAICGFALSIAAQHAARAQVNFADKTINMTIGFAAGGLVDLYGRTVGRYIARHLPGNPALVVQNQPGAGGVIALNDWPRKADPNGLSVTIGAQSQTDPDALRQTKAKFDPATFKMVGGLGGYSQGVFIRKEAISRLTDKSAAPVVAGMIGSTLRSGTYQILWGAAFLDWNIKWVRGYPSSAEIRQAIERGEIDMTTFGASVDIDYLMKSGKFTIIAQSGQIQDGKCVKRPGLSDAPIFSDLARPRITDARAKEVFAYWEAVLEIGMWVALPPSAPDDVVNAYVKAFDATIDDAGFKEEYGKLDPDSIAAAKPDIDRAVQELGKVSPETLEFLDAELKRQGFTTGP